MENNESKCVLLKKSEYDELIEKASKNRTKTTYIRFNYQFHDYYSPAVDVSGDIILSDKIFNQISRILQQIKTETQKMVVYKTDKATTDAFRYFEMLPWHKRLFFKNPYR